MAAPDDADLAQTHPSVLREYAHIRGLLAALLMRLGFSSEKAQRKADAALQRVPPGRNAGNRLRLRRTG
jgi:hypothetical protein